MLEIMTGRAGSGKTELCLSQVAERLQQAALGNNLFILVPEHMTYKMEQELLARLAKSGHGTLRCAVFGFRRFARQILGETGGLLEPQLTDVGRRLVIRRLLLEKQEAEWAGRMARRRGFAASLGDIIREFKCYNIKPENLAKAAETVGEKRLSHKLQELAELYASFNEALAGVYRDGEDLLERLRQHIPESAQLQGAEFWLDGFTFFNPQERAVLQALLQQGLDLHITLPMAAKGSQENEDTGIFPRARQTGLKLVALARELGVEVRFRTLNSAGEAGRRYKAAELARLEQGLYGNVAAKLTPPDNSGLRVVEAATPRLEVEAAAADIIRLCRERGLRWGDIGILVRDADSYDTLLPQVLQDYEIPFFSDKKRLAANHPLAELLRSALETVRTGWRYDSVFRTLKTGFFPLTSQELDFLENYVLEFGIRGPKRWLADEAWNWLKHSEFDDMEALQRKRERAAQADRLRRRAVAPLAELADALQRERTGQQDKAEGKKAARELPVAAAAQALYEFLAKMDAAATLAAWADEAEKAGRLAEAGEHRQIWEEIISLLEQLVEVSNGDTMTLQELEEVLGEGLDALEVSLIPPGMDYVTVAGFDQNSLANAKAIYVLGANAGVMPRRTSEDIILSDAERKVMLAGGGLEFPLVAEDASFNEKYLLYRGFTQAQEYLWVSYALADSNGEGRTPSLLVKRIKEIIDLRGEFLSLPLESLERQDDKLQIARGRQAVSALATALRGCRERGDLPGLWREVYNRVKDDKELAPYWASVKAGLFYQAGEARLPGELAERLFAPHRSLHGSVSYFEKYQECPFKYFAEKGLHLKEREIFGFQSYDFGTLLHAVLEKFGRAMQQADKRWGDTTEEERSRFCHAALAGLATEAAGGILLSAGQKKAQLVRIERTAATVLSRLCELDAQSKFHPAYFELSFQDEQGKTPLTYPLTQGKSLKLSGKIDRIDIGEDRTRFLVLDYKTGEGATQISLPKVYYGLKLQLLTYILAAQALLQQENEAEAAPEPAGLLYCLVQDTVLSLTEWPTEEKVAAKRQAQDKLPGWIVDDEELAAEIDGARRFLKYFRKDGKVNKGHLSGCSKSAEQLSVLLEFTLHKLLETGERILTGEVTARPYKDDKNTGCSWCSFHEVCGFEPGQKGCEYRELKKLEETEIWQRIDNELAEQAEEVE